ncbi:uncharacterized protein PV06_08322 [Exophiala oligosperma]|uniref:Uncharacterized protein n=1 Tax=Exophiala oligosperma TaxID=215243 RepID=A0A0D2D9D0_9EURO|nr:uncharacterized protein PV06_08322 [Exophiala oligosperma]KIW39733.1 hypothetical protein PV06_08322 [Exophiala oligosperma]
MVAICVSAWYNSDDEDVRHRGTIGNERKPVCTRSRSRDNEDSLPCPRRLPKLFSRRGVTSLAIAHGDVGLVTPLDKEVLRPCKLHEHNDGLLPQDSRKMKPSFDSREHFPLHQGDCYHENEPNQQLQKYLAQMSLGC